jgi:hypothetical protein
MVLFTYVLMPVSLLLTGSLVKDIDSSLPFAYVFVVCSVAEKCQCLLRIRGIRDIRPRLQLLKASTVACLRNINFILIGYHFVRYIGKPAGRTGCTLHMQMNIQAFR